MHNKELTLRGLSLFLKFFPFPTLATLLQIFWPPFTFSTPTWLLFQHGVILLPTCLPGLKGLNQMQCSLSFDWNLSKQNVCWHQLHPRFQVLQKEKCLGYPPERGGGVTETTICVDSEGATPSSNAH